VNPASPPRPALLETLYRISGLGGRARTSREALCRILAESLLVVEGSSGTIALIDPDTNFLQIEVYQNLPPDCADTPLRLGEGVTGWVALHGKPVVVPDVSADPRYRLLRPEVRSEIAVPIAEKDQVIGVINVDSDRLDAFGEAELADLVAVAEEACLVLRQLWRVEQLETKSTHLEAVLNVGRGIVSRLDLGEILHSITREAVTMSGCHLCVIHLVEDEPASLVRHALAGCGEEADHPDLPLNETLAGVSVHRRKQVEALDVQRTEVFPPLLEMVKQDSLASLLCTPIIFEAQVIGVLSAYTDRPHRFSNDERRLFDAMASLGAVAVYNARLYARVFQSEETLRRSEKLTALGLIAAEIAHEIRNPLTVVKLLFQSLGFDFASTDPRHKDVSIIEEKIDQLEAIVGRVLSFARPPDSPHSLWSFDEIIGDTLLLMRLKLQQAGIRVQCQPSQSSPKIEGNKGQFQQVLLNLLLNSVRAMENGGQISLRMGAETRDRQLGAYLEIEDTGGGIPHDLQPLIFQSLLTGHQEGTGLGLGIVKRIVESHHGRIELVRTGPTGTLMKLWIPAAR
jgi:signal transduction histidine kinase